MLITDFSEIVEIKRRRRGLTLQDLANVIGKSPVYTSQVINGYQRGKKADEYRQEIANYLDIVIAEQEVN
ncbi:hypothetical protein JNUCC83_05485 [Vagococcus sp. JNUCC 83]